MDHILLVNAIFARSCLFLVSFSGCRSVKTTRISAYLMNDIANRTKPLDGIFRDDYAKGSLQTLGQSEAIRQIGLKVFSGDSIVCDFRLAGDKMNHVLHESARGENPKRRECSLGTAIDVPLFNNYWPGVDKPLVINDL